jgi:hypothetical protein
MFGPSTAWLKMGISPAGRWEGVGDSKRTLWMNGFQGERIYFLMIIGKK